MATAEPYLIRVRCAHEDDRAFFRHFPTTTRMYLAEEELHQDRERPQEGIVDIGVHDRQLRAFRILLRGHLGDVYQRDAGCWVEEKVVRAVGTEMILRPIVAGMCSRCECMGIGKRAWVAIGDI